jgi:flagellar hook-basal body complex protein FliE
MTSALLLRAAQAANTYQAVDSAPAPGGAASSPGDFGALLSQTLGNAVQTGQAAEAQAAGAVGSGNGDITHVVTAVSRAELALQTTVAVRDRVLQAYQDIIKMPI